MKNKKYIFIPLFIFIGACVIALATSFISYKADNSNKAYSYQVIQLDYDGASDGVDPNGNSFNPVLFLTDGVILEGLKRSGLDSKYEVSEVRKQLVMSNVVPKGIVDEINSYTKLLDGNGKVSSSDYHPVRYSFALYHDLDKKLSSKELNELLKNIVDSYCEAFYSTYAKVYDTTAYNNIYAMENYDYVYQVEVFTNKMNILANLSRTIYAIHEDFAVDTKSFYDIAYKCDKIISNDVAKINTIIILNALSKDIDRLKDYYNYKIEMLNYDKTKYTADLASVTTQVNNYEKDSTVYVGSGENVIKVESNSSATYNALLTKQISLANQIASINASISEYQSILTDINNGVATDADYTLVQNLISKLESDYTALEEDFNKMLDAYNEKYVSNKIITVNDVNYVSTKLISTSFIVRCIKVGAPIVLATMLGICIYYLVRSSKKREEVLA